MPYRLIGSTNMINKHQVSLLAQQWFCKVCPPLHKPNKDIFGIVTATILFAEYMVPYVTHERIRKWEDMFGLWWIKNWYKQLCIRVLFITLIGINNFTYLNLFGLFWFHPSQYETIKGRKPIVQRLLKQNRCNAILRRMVWFGLMLF